MPANEWMRGASAASNLQGLIDLCKQGNGQPGSIVVTDAQTPVLLTISEPGSGNLTFTGYGAAKTIAPPAAG